MIWQRLFGYLPANLVGGLASFGAVFVYTRLLGAEAYGFYALALAAMNIVYTLTITWSEAAAYRFAGEAQAKSAMPDHIRTVLGLLLMSATLGVGIMAISAAVVTDPMLKLALAAAMATVALQPWVMSAQEMSRATGRVRRYSAVRMTQDIGAFALGTFLAWKTGLGAAAPFAGLAATLLLLAVTEGSRMWRESAGGRFRADQVRRYAAYGVPVAIALGLNIALDAGDRFLIAWFLGPEAVGVYAAGYGVADKSVGLICIWAAAAGGPLMMAAYESEGPEALKRVSAQAARTLMLVAAPAAAGLALVARPLADVMIAEDMRDQSAAIMPWIALSGLMSGFVMHYLSESFQLARRTDLRAGLMAVPAIANMALNIILLPRIGLMGAVYATVASYALALVLLAVVGRRLVPLSWPWVDFLKIAAACGVMALAVETLPSPGGMAELLMKAAMGAVAYAAAALALDAAGSRSALNALVRRAAPASS
jgi:O-antigen/teichoic acid export membrane protein